MDLEYARAYAETFLWDAEPRLERGASRLAALSRALHEPELRLLAARAGQPEATQES